jgi:hypothetical protein
MMLFNIKQSIGLKFIYYSKIYKVNHFMILYYL